MFLRLEALCDVAHLSPPRLFAFVFVAVVAPGVWSMEMLILIGYIPLTC